MQIRRIRKGTWLIVSIGLAVSLLAAGVLSFYASPAPDGLERVAQDQGFLQDAQHGATAALPTANYGIAGVENARLSTGLAGILGVLVMIAVGFGLFWLLGRGKKATSGTAQPDDRQAGT